MPYRKTYVEINVDDLKQNVKNIINYYNDYKYYIGVVKGNAYGCSYLIVNHLIDSGINYLAVSSLEEALSVRNQNKTIPVLILEPLHIEYIDICLKNNIAITISDYKYLEKLAKEDIKGKLTVHLKIDTGLNRLGIKDKNEVEKAYNLLINDSRFYLEGIFTHFSTFGLTDKFWDKQLSRFEELTEKIDLNKIPIIHLGKSSTLVHHPKIKFANAIRLGLIMFGFGFVPYKVSKLTKVKFLIKQKLLRISETNYENKIKLKPIFSLYSEIVQIKNVKHGEFVGYNMSYKAKEDILIAIIPIGYADGFSKNNIGREVEINNKRYPIIGVVSMDMIIVKVDESVKLYDKVTLIGGSVRFSEVTSHLGVTPCTVMTTTTSRVPRILVANNKVVDSTDNI